MNIVPPGFPVSGESPIGGFSPRPQSHAAIDAKWEALHDAGMVVCTIAGEEPENRADVRNFPVMIRSASPGMRALAENGIDDLIAMMEPGIAALLAVNARGIDASHAAGALWREFVAARDAVLALVPPNA